MKKRVAKSQLGRKSSHRKALVANLLKSLLTSGHLTTTTVKAKALKSNMETFLSRLSSFDKNDINLRRFIFTKLQTNKYTDILIKYLDTNKVSLSVVKEGFRAGDNAETSRVELFGYSVLLPKKVSKTVKTVVKKEEKSESAKDVKRNDENITNKIANTIKTTFSGTKERARSRSGL